MDLDRFIENNIPKKKISIFDEYLNDINKLIELNYSQKQVIEYLKTKCKNKTGLSESNLSRYLKKPKNEIIKKDKLIEKKDRISEVTSTEEDLLNLVGSFKKLV